MESSVVNYVQVGKVSINIIRDSHVSPNYFLLHFIGIPDQATEIGAGYILRDIFVTLVSLSYHRFLLQILGSSGESIGPFICPVLLILLELCVLRVSSVGR